MWAASEGNAAAADLLVEVGAEVKAKSKAGWTSFLFAVRNDHVEAAKVAARTAAPTSTTSRPTGPAR